MCVYQFLVVHLILGALPILCLHPQVRNSFHRLSSHLQVEEKGYIMDDDILHISYQESCTQKNE